MSKVFKGPDWKPASRKVRKGATKRARERQPICVICGDHAESTHHVYPRGQGGDDVPHNFVSTCGHGTAGCHGLLESEDEDTRRALGVHITKSRPDVILYLRTKLGVDQGNEWLRRHLFVNS